MVGFYSHIILCLDKIYDVSEAGTGSVFRYFIGALDNSQILVLQSINMCYILGRFVSHGSSYHRSIAKTLAQRENENINEKLKIIL
jgi:hypothetical protein